LSCHPAILADPLDNTVLGNQGAHARAFLVGRQTPVELSFNQLSKI